MPTELFQLKTVTRVFAENLELAEALGIGEVSALDDAERKWRSTLQIKAKGILEDAELSPTISLHRRRIIAEVELDAVEMTFEPSRRSPDWQEAVQLRIHYTRWVEGELHHAFVPGLGVHVFATVATLLPQRIEEHVRLVLASRRKHLTLLQLAELDRIQNLRLGQLDLTATRKTPKQIALTGEAVVEKSSVLAKLAEELPPLTSRTGETGSPPSKADFHQAAAVAFQLEAELQQLAQALSGPHRRSVLLVGPPGCGKTALVHELARRRSEFSFGQTPFWSTSGARLMTGPIGFGMWQERCQEMCRETAKTQAILHLGNLADLLEVGKASRGEQSVGGFLRPWIARGDLLAIAECTPEQLEAIERNNPHLLGAFQQMTVAERTQDQTRVILRRVLDAAPGKAVANTQGIPEALERLQQLHLRYATYSANPGRPLRFLKNILADQFPEKNITEAQVISAFSRETGLPPVLLDDSVPLDLDITRDWFARRVIGQPEAVHRVLDLLAMVKARLARPRKPLASFLFIGPTGTGKTEMAKSLAEFLFADAARLVRFDLNEYSDPLSVQRLIGGLATQGAEGLLTARVREQPFSVVLLDEFEKADSSFFDLLLQILGDGRLTDAAGRVADFCNSVIVMTSNLGAQGFQRGPAGFHAAGEVRLDAADHFSDAVRRFLRPEIFNRLDAIVPFQALMPDIVLAIARRHLELVRQRDGLRLRGVECEILPEVAEHLAARGYDIRYGARPLKRAIERELLVPLAEALNQYDKETPLRAAVSLVGGQLQVHVRARGGKEPSTNPPERLEDEVATAVVRQRRLIGRLQRCAAAGKIEDDVTMLTMLERRARAAKWKNPALHTRLAVLPRLRDCLQDLGKLAERACYLETEALGFLYQREALDRALFVPELDGLESKYRQLVREIFRLQQDQPNDVVVAVWGEPHDTMLDFARTYYTVAGELGTIEALDYFMPPPGGRSAGQKLLRETPKKIDQFFTKPPEKAIGVVMHARGDLISPRLRAEAGIHVVKEKKSERVCLIEVAALPFANYEHPSGIDRQGAIKGSGARRRRTFDREKEQVEDAVLGERPWLGGELTRCVAALIEDRLHRDLDAMTQ